MFQVPWSEYAPGAVDGLVETLSLHRRRVRRRGAAGAAGRARTAEPGAPLRIPAAIYTEVFKNIPLLAIIFLTYFGLASVGLGSTCSRRAASASSSSTAPTCPRLPRRHQWRPRWTAGGGGGARAGPLQHLRQSRFPAGAAAGPAGHQHDAGRPAEVHLAAGHHLGRGADVAGQADRLGHLPRAGGLPGDRRHLLRPLLPAVAGAAAGWSAGYVLAYRILPASPASVAGEPGLLEGQ